MPRLPPVTTATGRIDRSPMKSPSVNRNTVASRMIRPPECALDLITSVRYELGKASPSWQIGDPEPGFSREKVAAGAAGAAGAPEATSGVAEISSGWVAGGTAGPSFCGDSGGIGVVLSRRGVGQRQTRGT